MGGSFFHKGLDAHGVTFCGRFCRSSHSTIVGSRKHFDVARSPRLRRVAFEVGGHDVLGIIEISAPRVVTGNATVGVVSAVDLKRSKCLAVVADCRAELSARLDDVQRAEERIVGRGLGGESEREEEKCGFHFASLAALRCAAAICFAVQSAAIDSARATALSARAWSGAVIARMSA